MHMIWVVMCIVVGGVVSTNDTGVDTYLVVDNATFKSYSDMWLSSHAGWTKFDSSSLSCRGQNIFPVCDGDISIIDDSDSCPRAKCTQVVYCEHTPPDTIDMVPPPLLTTSDSHMCAESEFVNEVQAPHFGLNNGIPPLYTPLKVSNLRISGRLHARFGDICRPLVGQTVQFWHVDTRLLDSFVDPSTASQSLSDDLTPLTPAQIRTLSCRGEVITSAEGYFEIRTTMPFSYGPPRHINIMVTVEGYAPLVTRLYFNADVRLQQFVLDRHEEDNFDGLRNTFGTFLTHKVHGDLEDGVPTLSDYLGTDPRVVDISFVPQDMSDEGPVTGQFEGQHQLTLQPLRESSDSATTAPVPAYNLSGYWADDEGALIRVESHGHMFFAVQYPNLRTWGSVWGNLRGDTISGVDFRASGRAQASYEQQAALLDTWTQSDTVWSPDVSVGIVLPTDDFNTNRMEGSIEWSGGGYDNVWHKVNEPEAYRYLKLEVTRVGGETATGRLVINELEFFEGFLAQIEVPRKRDKLKAPRDPPPLAVSCSSFESQEYHCYKAFDGDDSAGSIWRTKDVGSRRQKITSPQWILLDMGVKENTPTADKDRGIDRGQRVRPTALRIVCGAATADKPEGCPMTFSLYGSNSLTKNFELIKHVDLYDYEDSIYANGGHTFHFFDEAPFGRLNGQKCGSCDKPPLFSCAVKAYDSTCQSQYCGNHGHCADPDDCRMGFYREVRFAEEGAADVLCKPCPAGNFGNASGLVTQHCSGECDEGCFCPEGSRSSCPFRCGGSGDRFCPKGSAIPIMAGAGYRTIDASGHGSATDTGISLEMRVQAVPCMVGHYCIDGVATECPVGTFGNMTHLMTVKCSGFCTSGWYCPIGSVVPTVCPKGHYCPDGKVKMECPGGTYGNETGLRDRECSGQCPLGYYCPLGSTAARANICPAGRFGERLRLSNVTCSGLCQEGYYCPAGSTSSTAIPCGDSSVYCPQGSPLPRSVSHGYFTIGGEGSNRRAAQEICSRGYFCSKKSGVQLPCPPGTYGAELGLEGDVGVTHCSGLCAPGYYCPYNSTNPQQVPCPAGTYGREYGLTDANCTALCPVGHYCPEGSDSPIKCPRGVFGGAEGLRDINCAASCEEGLCSNEDKAAGFCAEGFYCMEGSVSPVARECGGSDVYCPIGSTAPVPVSVGYYTIGGDAPTRRTAQIICEMGHYCVGGVKIACPPGVYGASEGLTTPSCSAPCPAGHYCPTGSFNGTSFRCPSGRYGSTIGLANRACSGLCAPGYYCPEGSVSETERECGMWLTGDLRSLEYTGPPVNANALYCPQGSPKPLTTPPGWFSVLGNSSTREAIEICPRGTYCSAGLQRECPAGRYGNAPELTTAGCSGPCRKGYYCPVGSTSSIQVPCPRGRYGNREGLENSLCSGPCTNPRHCEPGSTTDRPLPTNVDFS